MRHTAIFWLRTLRLTLAAGVVAILLIVSLFLPRVGSGPRPAAAAQIGCDETSLISAINTANTNGSGVIELPAGCTISLSGSTLYDGPGNTGTPAITGHVTIVGNGGVIRRSASATSPFRLFAVRGGTLNLINVTLKNGLTQGGSGASANSTNLGGAGGGGLTGNGAPAPSGTGGGGGGTGGVSPNATGSTGGTGVLGTGGNGSTGTGGSGGFGGGGGGSGTGSSSIGGQGGFGGGGGGGSLGNLGGPPGIGGGIGGESSTNGGGGGGGGFGGAIYVVNSTSLLTATGTTFISNTAQGGSG
ncbi:MAG: hypothetical protein ACYDBJ_16050, partial [Aggregatilineales bacterium]